MRLYSNKEWDRIPWGNTKEGLRKRSFFEPLLKEGVSAFVSNVESKVYILEIDDLLIPLTVNEKEYQNSYVCSIYSFLLYAEEEMQRHQKHFLYAILYPFLLLIKFWFRASKINQLVIINNLLISTSLYDALSPSQLQRIAPFLQSRFPHHALVFRSLNTYTEKILMDALYEIGCDLITTRSIYFFDPQQYPQLPSKKRWIIQKDKQLGLQPKIQILQHHDFHARDAAEIKRLYDLLNLEKYSSFNPAFTTRFFEKAICDQTFTLSGIKYEDRLVGFIGYFKRRGIMTTLVGYDTTLPEDLGLYRLLTTRVLEDSLSSNTIFNMSAGVGHFKRQRGAFQELESMAVLCNHLPFHRRFLWKVLKNLFNKIGAPVLKKYKL